MKILLPSFFSKNQRWAVMLLLACVPFFHGFSPAAKLDNASVCPSCAHKGFKLYGKIKVVEHFPDIKVKVVDHFPDLKVKVVNHFPDECGEWQFVEHFPDIKVQFVDDFPDIKISYVDHFPGCP